ncbi:MAG: Acyltransferase [Ferruginibacter sp.]|nr:Acyltransferase [Ferruginibacter sp.]
MELTATHKSKVYFENLDGLRFFCFLSVFFFHSFHTESATIEASPVFHFFKKTFAGNGFLGVNFFFVLSGFLITYLLIKEKRLNNKISVVNFWIRRILRIWPLYFACVFLGFVVFPLAKQYMGGVSTETANPWYYIFFINNFDYINKGMPDAPGLGVLWSIAIEEQFYFVWPLVLSLFPVKKFWIPFTIVIAGSLVFRAFNDVPVLHELHTLSCIGDMAIGALGAWLILEAPRAYNFIQNLSKLQIFAIYACLFVILFFRTELLTGHYVIRIFERAFIAVIMLLVILEQCYARRSFYKMSSLRIPSKLGLITYGLYCIHFIIISATVGLSKKLGMNTQVWQVVFLETSIAFVITVCISLLSYKYFEAPFLKLKDKFSFITKK